MNRIFLIIIFSFFLISCNSKNRTKPDDNSVLVPNFQIDTSINNISLDYPDSYERAFKNASTYQIKKDSLHKYPFIEFFNEGWTERMTVNFFNESRTYNVSKFEIEKIKGSEKDHELFMISHFKTNNGIKLGTLEDSLLLKIGKATEINQMGNSKILRFAISGNYEFLKKHKAKGFESKYTIDNQKVSKIKISYSF